MLKCVYRLVAPRTFEPVQVEADTSDSMVLVRPTHLSICNADQRYYRGARSEEVLLKKLPMALIHEAIGEVVEDGTGKFSRGDRVVMVPNCPLESDLCIAENYLTSSHFSGSGYDGFMQECVSLLPSRVIGLPHFIDDNTAAFTELVSVAVHAIARYDNFAHSRRDVIGIWGDGNMGFIVALVLRMLFSKARIVVFGRNVSKLNTFTFANEVYLTYDESSAPQVDHAFECCGGEGSVAAIGQIIEKIKPEGTISLLGVTENDVPINTRMILEKGLRLFGSSRSGAVDFDRTIELLRGRKEMLNYLNSLVGQVFKVNDVRGITRAFETDIHKSMGKTILQWNV